MKRSRPLFTLSLLRILCVCYLGLSAAPSVVAQGDPTYVEGKVYVIRITPFTGDTARIARYMNDVRAILSNVGGISHHVDANLYPMRSAADDRWFIGYFHADRQSKEELMRDLELLTWLFHGDHVQTMPIEQVKSPLVVPKISTSEKKGE